MTVQLPDPATEDCRALRSILALVADKWTVLIVVLLGDGPKRFNEIKRMVGGISHRMLTFTLRGLGRRPGDADCLPHHSAACGLRVDQAWQHLVGGRGTAQFVGTRSCERDPQIAGTVRREDPRLRQASVSAASVSLRTGLRQQSSPPPRSATVREIAPIHALNCPAKSE